jgi:hypothetical protein
VGGIAPIRAKATRKKRQPTEQLYGFRLLLQLLHTHEIVISRKRVEAKVARQAPMKVTSLISFKFEYLFE